MNELSITRFIDAPPATVWDAMTNRLSEWFCPAPWRADIDRDDRCAGGQLNMTFRGPDGEEMPQNGTYLAYEEGRRFVTTDAVTGDYEPAGPFMIGLWEIEPEGDGTRFTATARHWTEEACDQHREMGFEQGWNAAAEQLAGLCENN